MPNPSNKVTVTVGDYSFNAISAQVGLTSLRDHIGMPLMGSTAFSISVTVDMYDTEGLDFAALSGLFELSHHLTRDKIKDVKIEFWKDANRQDAVCVYNFQGWISSFFTISQPESNHLLSMTIEPKLDQMQFVKLSMSN